MERPPKPAFFVGLCLSHVQLLVRIVELWAPDEMGRPALVAAACARPKARSQQLLQALLQQRAQPQVGCLDGWVLQAP